MATRYFKVQASNGDIYIESQDFDHDDPVTAEDLDGYDNTATIIAETSRIPEEFEVVGNDGSITANVEQREDTRAGTDHIKLARILKVAEASYVLSGNTLTEGMLFREAQGLGITVPDLAQQVMQAAAPFIQKEVQRRVAKST